MPRPAVAAIVACLVVLTVVLVVHAHLAWWVWIVVGLLIGLFFS